MLKLGRRCEVFSYTDPSLNPVFSEVFFLLPVLIRNVAAIFLSSLQICLKQVSEHNKDGKANI